MTLPNHELEEKHNELHSLLNQRREELARGKDDDNAEAAKATENLSDEIDRWHDEAAKVEATPEDENAVAELLSQARQLTSDLQNIHVG